MLHHRRTNKEKTKQRNRHVRVSRKLLEGEGGWGEAQPSYSPAKPHH